MCVCVCVCVCVCARACVCVSSNSIPHIFGGCKSLHLLLSCAWLTTTANLKVLHRHIVAIAPRTHTLGCAQSLVFRNQHKNGKLNILDFNEQQRCYVQIQNEKTKGRKLLRRDFSFYMCIAAVCWSD